MRPPPFRRRAIALIAVGFTFLALGLSGHGRHAYTAVALCFFVIGIATLRRGKDGNLP